jgi:hypothetical protein
MGIGEIMAISSWLGVLKLTADASHQMMKVVSQAAPLATKIKYRHRHIVMPSFQTGRTRAATHSLTIKLKFVCYMYSSYSYTDSQGNEPKQ